MARRPAVLADPAPELTSILRIIGPGDHSYLEELADQLRHRLATYQVLMSRAAALLIDQRLMAPERGEVARLLRGELDKMA